MSLPANAVQRAVYERLAATVGMPVYDHVPQNAAPPYIAIGADTSVPWRTKSRDGQSFTLTIHTWDAPAAGRKGVKTAMEAVYAALHLRPELLAVGGHRLLDLECEFAETYQEPAEGDADHYYHGVLRFRALVYQD